MRTHGLLLVFALTTMSYSAHAASLDYNCTNADTARALDDARQRGRTGLFNYRLNRAVAAGHCYVTSTSASGGGSPAKVAARENRFPPPWLFRPLR